MSSWDDSANHDRQLIEMSIADPTAPEHLARRRDAFVVAHLMIHDEFTAAGIGQSHEASRLTARK